MSRHDCHKMIEARAEIIDVTSNKVVKKLWLPNDLSKLKEMVKNECIFIHVVPIGEYKEKVLPFFYTITDEKDVDNLAWMLEWLKHHPDNVIEKKDRNMVEIFNW